MESRLLIVPTGRAQTRTSNSALGAPGIDSLGLLDVGQKEALRAWLHLGGVTATCSRPCGDVSPSFMLSSPP